MPAPQQRGVQQPVALLYGRGRQIVHGHSTIPETFGIAPAAVRGPVTYADGLAMAVDTGISLGAPCIIVALTPAA